MQVTRPLHFLRPSLSSLPSTSRSCLKPAQHDRYIAIHSFFSRQARLSLEVRGTPPVSLVKRWNSNKPCPNCTTPKASPTPTPTPPVQGHAQDYTPFIRRLIQQSSSLTPGSKHRPSKEDLLAAANGWWQRLGIRIKWFMIRGWRRFNTDDLSAFASWFVVGNTLWILIGTTTFVSAVFATLNSLSLQEYVARWISDYLTSSSGVTVIFESAIVPKWGASTITFRNVYVSRRPTEPKPQPSDSKTKTASPPSPIPFLSSSLSPETYLSAPPAPEGENYTMFDVNFDEVEVTLSFMRWLDGKGLVQSAKIKGVRGVVDRRSVWWDYSKPMHPADFRHETHPGDFELDSLTMEDFLVTIYQPGGQRPFNVSIFNATVGPLRKRWFFYDMMSAEAITGQFDNCLFSLHMPQKLGREKEEDGAVKRMARFRIDGLPIEHAQHATGSTGPMSWITSGKLDAVLDIKFPPHPDDEVDIKAIFEEIGRNVIQISQGTHPDEEHKDQTNARAAAAAVEAASRNRGVIPGQHRLARPALRAPALEDAGEKADKREVTVDIDLRFRDLKAAVPIYTSDLSVTNNALIRPIVAFINANRTLVPIHCQVSADLSDFDGSWTLFETGLMTSVSDQIYAALAYHVSSETANSKRIRQVGFWGIQRGAEVLLDTLRNVVDPVHGQLVPLVSL
ncbi:hypothetical protein P7C73_g2101, partial [Tremellales sp. Uapishka_1]